MVLGSLFAECFAVLFQGVLLNCIQTSTSLCRACRPTYQLPCDSDDFLHYDPPEDEEEWQAGRDSRTARTRGERSSHSPAAARWTDQSVQTDPPPSQGQGSSPNGKSPGRVIREEPRESKMERTPLLPSHNSRPATITLGDSNSRS